MRPARVLTATVALIALAGCDTIYGVSSGAHLSAPTDEACISTALAAVPGITVVDRTQRSNESHRLWPKPGRIQTQSHVWIYDFGGPKPGIVQTHFDDRGEGHYSNSLRRMGVRIPPADMSAFEPVMNRVDAALQARCGLTKDLTISRQR
jgi:hypothetical protein